MLSGNIFQAMEVASAATADKRKIGPFVLPQILVENLKAFIASTEKSPDIGFAV